MLGYISVSPAYFSELVIHGATSVFEKNMPMLLYHDSIPACDDYVEVCADTIIIPITINQRVRYVNISTNKCLKSFSVEAFASKSLYIHGYTSFVAY